jgi:hypothetical protein
MNAERRCFGRLMLAPVLPVLMLASGCAPMQSGAPVHEEPPVSAAVHPKPSAQLLLEDDVLASFSEAVQRSAQESGLFGAVTAVHKPQGAADLTIRLRFTGERRPVSDTETVWDMTTALLFTVYPSTCARDEYELVADVWDRTGMRLKSYDLRDTDTSWLWLYQGDNCGNAPLPARVKDAAARLLTTLYADIDGDGLLALANRGVTAGDVSPRVYLSANRAKDIIERAALTAPLSVHFVSDPESARTADFTLRIELDFGRSEPTLVRTVAAISTLALISPCEATEFSLKAELSDRTGNQVRAYALSDSYRSRFVGGKWGSCHSVDEFNDPEDVADFVGKLFAELKEDGVFSAASAQIHTH